MSQSATALVDESGAWSALSSCGAPAPAAVMDLLDYFARVSDPRRVRWVQHPVSVVLALCAGAVVAGMRSFTAIAGWVSDAPADLLVSVYARRGRVLVLPAPPSKATIWRVLTDIDAASVDAVIGAWLSDRAEFAHSAEPVNATTAAECAPADTDIGTPGPMVLAVDGKTVRAHHQGLVVAQVEVGAKTNEIPMLPTLLDGLDITGAIITADALHTQRATTRHLHGHGAEFVLCVKENQPTLFACLDALP